MSSVSLYLQQQLTCDDDTTLLLQDCYLLEERERLQEEWRLFREQKKNFEKERKSFTEAAIRLGLEVLAKGALMGDGLQVLLLCVLKCSHPAISVSDAILYKTYPWFFWKILKIQKATVFVCIRKYSFCDWNQIIFVSAFEIS